MAFTTSGIDGDVTSATVTFSDGVHSVTVDASAGVADLSGFDDGPVSSVLNVTDGAGNTASANGAAITTDWGPTLFAALLRARWRHGWRYPVLEDTSGTHIDYMKLVAGALVLGRKFAAQTEPGERVGVLVPNVNAAAVTFMALQAFGRVPAMLNFSAGPANLEAAVATAKIKLVISSGEFVAKAKLEPAIAAIGGHARLLWLEDLRGQVSTADRLRGLWDGLFAGRIHAPSASAATTRRWSCSPRARRAGPRGWSSATATSWPTAPRSRRGSTSTSRTRCSTPCRCFTASGSPAPCSCRRWVGSRSICTPRRCTTGSCRSWSTAAMPRSSLAPTASSRAMGAWVTRTTSAPCAIAFAGAEAIQDETQRLWFDKFGVRILDRLWRDRDRPCALAQHAHALPLGHGRPPPARHRARLEPVAGLDRGGRLWVKGPNVMLGYLRYEQPGVLEPPEDGWYDTGDIVDLDAEGFVTILGRAKRFAKIGGEMVSLARSRTSSTAPAPTTPTRSPPCPTRARASASSWSPPTSPSTATACNRRRARPASTT